MATPEEIMEIVGAGPWTDAQDYLRMDERRALSLFIRQASRTIPLVRDDPGEWMLLIESVHGATQIAMAAHLSGSARIGAQTSSSATRVLNGDWSRERSADFGELLDRLSGTKARIESDAPVLAVSTSEKEDLILLNELRCGLVHIMPVGWSIEIVGLPRLALTGARIVQRIIQSGFMLRVADEDECVALGDAVARLVGALEALDV